MKKITGFALAVAVALASSPASALEWTTMGPRAMGMGGAGVADTTGPLAAYWNPAALGEPSMDNYGLAIPISVQANIEGPVVAGAKDLQDCKNNNCSDAQVQNALNELNHPGEGLAADAGASGNLKIGKLNVFLNGFVVGAVEPYGIQTNTNNTEATIGNNTSSVVLKGARILELGAGYGHELPWVPGLYVGGDFKIMRAEVGFDQIQVISNGSGGSSNLTANGVNSSNVGIDVGTLWDVNKTFDGAFWNPKVGLTGRNINDPKFTEPTLAQQAGFERFTMNPQWRTGLSFSPEHWWHFAADADLTRNLTPLDGYADQDIGAGTEIDVFNRSWINIPLRVGIKHNLALANDGATYTLGTGVNLLHLIVDVSGEVGNQSIQLQTQGKNQSIPRTVGAAIQLSFLFGGSDANYHADSNSDAQPVSTNKARNDMSQSDTDRVRADAGKAQQELNNQTAPSGN